MPGPPARIIALEGPSGAGKSRAARELADRLPGALLLPEAFQRLSPRPSLAVPTRATLLAVERRLFREELRRWREAQEARARGRPVVADTGFLGPLTYALGLAELDPSRNVVAALRAAAGRAVRNRALGLPDLTVYLSSAEATRARRVASDPAGHPALLHPRHTAVGRREARLWLQRWGPRLGPRFRRVASGGPTGAYVGRIERWLAAPDGPGPLAPRGAGAQLRELLEALPSPRARVKNGTRRGPNPRP